MYSDQELIRKAKKYNNKKDFNFHDNEAYEQARRKGINFLESICSHMELISRGRKIRDFTKKSCKETAQKYWTRSAFCQNEPIAYHFARRQGVGYLDSICKHMRRYRRKTQKLDFDICLELAQTVRNARDFKKAYPHDFNIAVKEYWMPILINEKLFNSNAPVIDPDLDETVDLPYTIVKDNVFDKILKYFS